MFVNIKTYILSRKNLKGTNISIVFLSKDSLNRVLIIGILNFEFQ